MKQTINHNNTSPMGVGGVPTPAVQTYPAHAQSHRTPLSKGETGNNENDNKKQQTTTTVSVIARHEAISRNKEKE